MSDYSPPYTDEDAKLDARKDKVVKRIHAIKLKHLTVGDMLALVGIFFHRHFSMNERDVERMEEILKGVKHE